MADQATRQRILLVCPGNLLPRESALARGLAAQSEVAITVPGSNPAVTTPAGGRMVGVDGLGSLPRHWRPDFVVYASPPSLSWHWKVWRWKRRHASRALLGGYWPSPASTTGPGWFRRRSAAWALDSLDFLLIDDEEAAKRFADAETRRVRTLVVAGEEGAEAVTAFLGRRRQAEERSVLWVDDDLSLHSPSTKHLVYSLPHLQAQGWEVRGWCLTADATARAGVEIRQFPPAPRALRLFTPYWFFVAVNLHGVGQRLLKGRPTARIVHTVGGTYLGADLASIQFVNHVWLRKQVELGVRNLKDVAMLGLTLLGACKDQLQFSNPRCRLFLPASDSIGEEVRRRCLRRTEVQTLANSYDETRFNPAVRQQWRERMRRELGFTEADTVFCFASQGHYKRKGFWLAAGALAGLRRGDMAKAKSVRLLVIGGQPGTLERLQAELTGLHPDWREWIKFVGSQSAVERYFASADAFLFPSYFEAFCLAEIEAGAMGLPLLLTPHHGTEMILQDGVNGLRLSYDPAAIATVLAGFLNQGLPTFTASPGRALDRGAYAQALAGIYERELRRPPAVAATPPA